MNKKIFLGVYWLAVLLITYFAASYLLSPNQAIEQKAKLAPAPLEESPFSLAAASSLAILVILCIFALYLPIGFAKKFFKDS